METNQSRPSSKKKFGSPRNIWIALSATPILETDPPFPTPSEPRIHKADEMNKKIQNSGQKYLICFRNDQKDVS
jgi:hypothetical protein